MSTSKLRSSQDFFVLRDPLAAQPLRLGPDEQWWDEKFVHRLSLGKELPSEPIVLRVRMGGVLREFLWSTYVGYICVSQRVVDLLKQHDFTGWATYPVKIYGREGQAIEGYHGFAITGPQLEWDRSLSQIVTKRVPWGKGSDDCYVGLLFHLAEWDGSDFFWVGGSKVVTGRVARSFKKDKVTNVRLIPISEYETSVDTDEFLRRRGL
ncbi:MAG: hypothetical protein HYX87_07000 [Chloroflexi bacterium]|nr:hypothetical protein [Chloroflexota bacterium]